jgi:hypothetical protein
MEMFKQYHYASLTYCARSNNHENHECLSFPSTIMKYKVIFRLCKCKFLMINAHIGVRAPTYQQVMQVQFSSTKP